MRVLFDTCVIVDVLQHREEFFRDSYRAVLSVASRNCEGLLTAKSLTDLHYLMHKHLHDNAEVHKQLKLLLELFTLVDTSAEDCIKALQEPGYDFEDTVLLHTALRLKADAIVTRNICDFQTNAIPIWLPGELLSHLIEHL